MANAVTEVRHFALKEEFNCPCTHKDCPRTGSPKQKRLNDGSRHVRACTCLRCRNGENRKNGLKKGQVKAARALGSASASTLKPGNEETLRTVARFESKEGAQCRPVHTFYNRCKDQSDVARSFADNRPFIATATYDGRLLMIIDGDVAPEFVAQMGAYYGFWSA